MKNLVKTFIIYGLTSSLGKFIGLFLVPIFTRIFTPEQYGVIDIIQSFTLVAAIFGILLLESAIQRYFYELDEIKRIKYISTVFWTVFVLSFLLSVIIIIFSEWLSTLLFSSPEFKKEISVSIMIIPVSNLFTISTTIFRYIKKPFTYLSIILLQVVLTILGSIFFVKNLEFGIIGVFYGQLIGWTVPVIVSFFILKEYYRFLPNFRILKELFRFCLPMFPARVGTIANTHVNRFIMLNYLTLGEIGLFTIAFKIASLFRIFESAFTLSWYPYFYENLKKPNHRKLFRKTVNLIITCVLGFVCILSFFTQEFLNILATPEYFNGYYLIGLLMFGIGLRIINSALNMGILITKKTKFSTYIYLLSAAINIILLFVFLSRFGMIVVPISLAISYLMQIIMSWIISEKLYPIGYNKLYFLINLTVATTIIVAGTIFEMSFLVRLFSALFITLLILVYITSNFKVMEYIQQTFKLLKNG